MNTPFKAARKARGLTQVEIADKTGVSQRLVSTYDNGHIPESVALAARAAKAVGLTLDEMFPGAAEAPIARSADETTIEREGFDQTEGA